MKWGRRLVNPVHGVVGGGACPLWLSGKIVSGMSDRGVVAGRGDK